MHADPQDPYHSYLLSASAGSGKTYQLAKRFHTLVAAGSEPASILTITFTKKAAAEMRERIVSDASALLHSPALQDELRAKSQEFFRARLAEEPDKKLAPPRSPRETAQIILSASQSLRITTIDSIFWEWIRKFPLESGLSNMQGRATALRILDPFETERLQEKSVRELLSQHFDFFRQLLERGDLLDILSEDQGILGMNQRLVGLFEARSFIWYCQHASTNGEALRPHRLPPEAGAASETDLLQEISPDLARLISDLGPTLAEAVTLSLRQESLDELLASGLFTKELKISGRHVRGKKREAWSSLIAGLEEKVLAFTDAEKLLALNSKAQTYFALFQSYERAYEEEKQRLGGVDFADLARGAYTLFHSPDAASARFLIHRHTKHLIVDEFQDTSRLQWAVFRALASELLSGEGLEVDQQSVPATVFFVGDKKQSIYGFREADPEVMNDALQDLSIFGLRQAELNQSFRTAPVILGVVNEAFREILSDFPEHSSAGLPHCSTKARVLVLESQRGQAGEETSAEGEARTVAQTLKTIFSEASQWRVYDKRKGAYRSLRFEDCALLFRFSTHMDSFTAALAEAGIPAITEKGETLFDRPEIKDVLALLKFLFLPEDREALFSVLKSPIVGIPDGDLMEALAGAEGSVPRLFASLATKYSIQVKTLTQLLAGAPTKSTSALLAATLSDFHVFARYQRDYSPNEFPAIRANLLLLTDLVLDLEKQGITALGPVVLALRQRAEKKDLLPGKRQANAVSLLTIHKSKGLEFPLVIVLDCGGRWEKRDRYWVKFNRREEKGLAFIGRASEQPLGCSFFSEALAQLDEELRSESARLLYVALTRARQYLLLSGTGKSKGAPSFLDRAREALQVLGATTLHLGETEALMLEDEGDEGATLTEGAAEPETTAVEFSPLVRNDILLPTKILRPHQAQGKKRQGASKDAKPSDQVFLGRLIHAGLCASLSGETLDFARAWRVAGSDYQGDNSAVLLVRAQVEVEKILTAENFRALFLNAKRIDCELPVAGFIEERLVRGVVDLLITYEDGSQLVLDYKTSARPGDLGKGRAQLRTYVELLRGATPRVSGMLFLTEELKLVKLADEDAVS